MNDRITAVVGVPIDSLGFAGPLQAVEKMPGSLRKAGLIEALGIRDLGDLPVRISKSERDPVTGMISPEDCSLLTSALRAASAALLTGREKPLFIGGCCSMVPGLVAGLRDASGKAPALIYIDAHLDLYDGTTTWQGEMADMPLAILFEKGPPGVFDSALAPTAELHRHVYLLGYRDEAEALSRQSILPRDLEPELVHFDEVACRRIGFGELGRRIAAQLSDHNLPLHLHIDLDVLAEHVFPATMYQLPGGLDWPELRELAAPFIDYSGLKSISIGCYDPDRDPEERLAAEIVGNLAVLFLHAGQ